jgi:hypothetical protein
MSHLHQDIQGTCIQNTYSDCLRILPNSSAEKETLICEFRSLCQVLLKIEDNFLLEEKGNGVKKDDKRFKDDLDSYYL